MKKKEILSTSSAVMANIKTIFAWFALALVLLIAGIGWLFMQMAGGLYVFCDDLIKKSHQR